MISFFIISFKFGNDVLCTPFQVGGAENVIHYTYCTKVLYLHLLDRSNIISVLWKRNQIFQNDIRWCFFFLIFNVFRTNADFTGNFKDAFVHMGFYLISDGKIPVKWTMKIQKEGLLFRCCWLCSNRISAIHSPLLSFLFDW